jgi:hypothetical protein
VLGNHRGRLLVVHVRMRIRLLELTQRFDAVIGSDEDIGVFVHVFQDCAQHLVESDVLVREGEPVTPCSSGWVLVNIVE